MPDVIARDLSPFAYALARIGARLTRGQFLFSPGTPNRPLTPDAPPVRMQTQTGGNLIWDPRREFAGLVAYDVLRALARQHVIASLCIRVRCAQAMAARGAVVARNRREQAALQRDIDDLNAFFAAPDRETPLSAWLARLIRDVLEIDAPTVYFHPARGGGVAALEVIDGATIKPILDDRGRVVMYQQVLSGIALSNILGRAVAPNEEQVVGEFAPGELWYQPYAPSTTSPYGRPPMEDLYMLAQVYLRKLGFDLAHYTEGNIPAALGIFDGSTLDVQQVAEFERAFNARMAGDLARGAKIHFIPFPVRIERLVQLSQGGQYETAWEERNVKIVCAHYGVTPQEIGFTSDVNRATAELQENVAYRVGILPMLNWLKSTLIDDVIQRVFGYRALEWRWDVGEVEDKERTARIHHLDIQAGVITPQESRAMRYPDLHGAAPSPAPVAPDLAQIAKAAGPDDAERERLIRVAESLFRRLFGEQAEMILDVIRRERDPDAMRAALADLWLGEPGRLAAKALPVFDAIVAAGLKEGEGYFAVSAGWGEVNEAALRLARERAAAWAQQATQTSEAQVAQAIADWVETGGTLDDLLARLDPTLTGWQRARAEATAITEVTRLYADANRMAWRESGLVARYRVETANDELVCLICRSYYKQEYDLNDDAGMPPFHVRCRCWIVPIVQE